MANDFKIQLCDELQFNEFSLQLDESALRDNECFYFFMYNLRKKKKILLKNLINSKLLTTNTSGMSVCETLENFFVKKKNSSANNSCY